MFGTISSDYRDRERAEPQGSGASRRSGERKTKQDADPCRQLMSSTEVRTVRVRRVDEEYCGIRTCLFRMVRYSLDERCMAAKWKQPLTGKPVSFEGRIETWCMGYTPKCSTLKIPLKGYVMNSDVCDCIGFLNCNAGNES